MIKYSHVQPKCVLLLIILWYFNSYYLLRYHSFTHSGTRITNVSGYVCFKFRIKFLVVSIYTNRTIELCGFEFGRYYGSSRLLRCYSIRFGHSVKEFKLISCCRLDYKLNSTYECLGFSTNFQNVLNS